MRKIKIKVFLAIIIAFIIMSLYIMVIDNSISSKDVKTMAESNNLYSEIILPPGSTSVELQNAINNADSEDIIIISSDMEFSSIVIIPVGKTITIRVDYRRFLGVKDNCRYKTS